MSRATRTLLGAKARKAVIDGVNAIYQPVRQTLGPQSKKALLYRTFGRGSRIVDDGYMVAEVQEPQDVFVRLAAQTFKETCKKTNEKVGDATTTTVILGGRLMNDCYRLLSEGSSDFVSKGTGKIGVMTLRDRILKTAEKVKEEINKVAKKVETLEELEKIATVSVEDKELGKIIAKMAWEVGLDGFIDVVEGYKGEIETEVNRGMRFAAKVAARAFVNNPNRYEMVVQDTAVLITNYAFDDVGGIAQMLQRLNTSGVTKIIVIAPSFSDNTLVNMINATKQGFFFYPVKTPSLRTEQYEDLSVFCGASFIDKQKGRKLSNVTTNDLGFLEKLIVKDTEAREEAVATGGKGTMIETITVQAEEEYQDGKDGKKTKKKFLKDKKTTQIAERIEMLKGQLEETKEEQFKKLLQRRIASMASAVGVIRVGDSTQASSLYRKLKIEDAVYACKSALRGGYVKGGGLCLKDISETLPDEDIFKASLRAPYEQIQSSIDGGLEIGDEIIDPAEAMYYAVEFATSVAANLITVEILTVETEDVHEGDGAMAIARALMQGVYAQKQRDGIMKENEQEMEKDRLGGLNTDEIQELDNG